MTCRNCFCPDPENNPRQCAGCVKCALEAKAMRSNAAGQPHPDLDQRSKQGRRFFDGGMDYETRSEFMRLKHSDVAQGKRIAELLDENTKLKQRQQELLQTIANLTHTVPFPDEYQGWEGQRAALLAEIGSLRAQVAELKRVSSAKPTDTANDRT